MAGRTILIDADILAYQIASSQEEVFEFNGRHVLHADLEVGKREVNNAVEYILDKVDGDDVLMCLTGENNFRKGVLPSYKANRTETRKPMILPGIREYIQETFPTALEDKLEGDDLIGIYATEPCDEERVIFSADKDMMTIPGLHWDADDGMIIEQSEEEADRFFYIQTLSGDPVDNYSGCPGVGAVKAAEMLDNKQRWVEEERTLKSGPRKGDIERRWVKQPCDDVWKIILGFYRRAGLKEKDALQQARCARILRHGEYDFEKKEVNLWHP